MALACARLLRIVTAIAELQLFNGDYHWGSMLSDFDPGHSNSSVRVEENEVLYSTLAK